MEDLETKVRVLEETVKTHDEKLKTNSEQHKNFFERFEKQAINEGVMGERFNQIMAGINSISARIDAVEKKPEKRWEMVIAVLITAVVTYAVNRFLR